MNKLIVIGLLLSALLFLLSNAEGQEKYPTVSVEFYGDSSLLLQDFQLLHFQVDLVDNLSRLAHRKFVLSSDEADYKITVYASSLEVSPIMQSTDISNYSGSSEDPRYSEPIAGEVIRVKSKVVIKGIVYAKIETGSKSTIAGSPDQIVSKEKLLLTSENDTGNSSIRRNKVNPLPVQKPLPSSDFLVLHVMPDKTWRQLLEFIKQNPR